MTAPQQKTFLTPQEYLRIEREADFKSQYFAGEMFSMAGGKPEHSLISANVVGTLRTLLKGHRCTAYESNLRIAVSPDGLYTYPDASVFCEPMTFVDGESDTAMNPTLLVEVLSKSTEAFDRGKKFELYRQIATLREYVLVAQDEPLIEGFLKEGDGRWVLASVSGLAAVLRLESLEIDLPLAEVYEKVEFGGARQLDRGSARNHLDAPDGMLTVRTLPWPFRLPLVSTPTFSKKTINAGEKIPPPSMPRGPHSLKDSSSGRSR